MRARYLLSPERNFYPRSPCGERHEGVIFLLIVQDFYPRSPCGERQYQPHNIITHPLFLSTLSLRRATRLAWWHTWRPPHFYPRSPCGERRRDSSPFIRLKNFYPRSPCGERQVAALRKEQEQQISIHALLAESDFILPSIKAAFHHFYPRSPCGERLGRKYKRWKSLRISIHALLAESDAVGPLLAHFRGISIHALLAESDPQAAHSAFASLNFYPRSPCGERPCTPAGIFRSATISIHALLAESDSKSAQNSGALLRI